MLLRFQTPKYDVDESERTPTRAECQCHREHHQLELRRMGTSSIEHYMMVLKARGHDATVEGDFIDWKLGRILPVN